MAKRKNVLLCNGGGPTAVMNLTNIGVVEGCLDYGLGNVSLYASLAGTGGLIGEHATPDGKRHVVNLDSQIADGYHRQLIKNTPSTWIGSGRYKLGSVAKQEKDESDEAFKARRVGAIDADIARIIAVCDELKIDHVFFVGGDDTLTTLHALADYAQRNPREVWPTFLSVPKTIDNDLPYEVPEIDGDAETEGIFVRDGQVGVIDACPGFGTAANFVANTVAHLAVEALALNRHYVIEIMGRNAGFLTAASLVARQFGYGPHLIAVPEHGAFDEDKFCEFVLQCEKQQGFGVYCVSEGIEGPDGEPVGTPKDAEKDPFGHVRLGGVGAYLAELAKAYCKAHGAKVDARGIRPAEMQRICVTYRSKADAEISYNVGHRAAYWGLERGQTGNLVTIVRNPGKLKSWSHGLVPTPRVAKKKREMDDAWIDWDKTYDCEVPTIDAKYLEYLNPLIDTVVPIAPAIDADEIEL